MVLKLDEINAIPLRECHLCQTEKTEEASVAGSPVASPELAQHLWMQRLEQRGPTI